MRRSLCFGAFLFLATVFSFSATALAQGPDAAGINIIPATVEKLVDPGSQLVEILTVTNLSDEDKEYYLYVRNIKGVEAGGRPIFSDETNDSTGYELKDWISLPEAMISVPANGEYEVPITVNVPEGASPGSHFGGVFVSQEAPRLRTVGAGVGYEVASIFSLRISGDVVDDALIRAFSADKLLYGSKNATFEARVENRGNILIRPRGTVTITNMFGSEVARLSVNEDLAGVFPGTVRDLDDIIWDDGGIGFGQYEAVIGLSYEGNGGARTIDAAVSFWILPTKIIVPVLISLAVLFGLIYLFVRLYIRSAMMQAGGGRRIAPTRYRKQVGISRFAFVFATLLIVLTLFLIVVLVIFA